jgi:hypothetical protein
MKRRLLLGMLLAGALFAPGPAVADAVRTSAPLQGQCMGIQSAYYASVSKDNSTGTEVARQARAGIRASLVVSYHADCPNP